VKRGEPQLDAPPGLQETGPVETELKLDSIFPTSFDPHSGHLIPILSLEESTKLSKILLHFSHLYS